MLTYTFENVTANHTIHVTFKAVPVFYTVTASAGQNGTINPDGVQSVLEGNSITFTITPDEDFEIDTLFIDGAAVNPVLTYTFENISSNHTIHVTFKATPVIYTVTASAGQNGTINPDGVQ